MLLRLLSHGRTSEYARSGLFKGLSAFSELERRIEQLPTEQERGDAFEVFIEAYLNTDEVAQADEVWVVGKVPAEVRRKLNLPPSDYGYDGVYRTRLGELIPYQAKFRTGRTALPYRELSTFFGITEKAERRVVLTNAVGIAEVAKSRTNFNATRGTDFDRLDAAQLSLIAIWIEGQRAERSRREPRPYQAAALTDIKRELAERNRAQVIMACGTGKTLVALWAAEQTQANRVLVLVPSLNLIRQTLHEWAKWTNWGERFRYLCVCSDPKVAKGIDEIEIRPEDADFEVRTDPAIVSRFLKAPAGAVSVVFSTYQSASVVGEAVRGQPPFDLGIFDEAHKTTGRGKTFTFALSDKNLPIRKRLFLTATPRHYNLGKRDQEGDFLVTSMDDESVYGRVAHRLTFAQAAEQKIIVPYKVVISVVDHPMIDNALMDQAEVDVKGDPVRAKWVAHQIALKEAVDQHNLQRVITFHSSIRAAAAFASDNTEGIEFFLPQFSRFHVSGAQPTAEREERMREFERADRAVITNARCLTEGVDVPSVDMVAFMNPRRSKVDIVQAVGRAMRTSDESKTCGFVLVPLFLELRQGETLTEALERSDFDEIAQVLNALRDNDDELRGIIQALSVEKGRTGGFDESRLRDKVEVLGPQIQLAELAASIRTLLVIELGVTWDERYGQLLVYKQTHGDCNVPAHGSDNPELGRWCGLQRLAYKRNILSPDRIARLEQLGFAWDPLAAAWEEMFAALRAYKQTHGDCNVPSQWKDNPELGTWRGHQRKFYKTNKLSPERVARLEQLGFMWDPRVAAWEEMFAALRAYKQTHGDCNVPRRWKDNPELATWCETQKREFKDRKLSRDHIARLEQLGFVWDRIAAAWEEMFAALSAYKQVHGDCNVPQAWTNDAKLGRWCTTQRLVYKKGELASDRVTRLEQLGFIWDRSATVWEEMFAALRAYKQTHGDSNVPLQWKDNPGLGRWCGLQRHAYKRDKLSPDRIARLEQLGFAWDPLAVAWEEMFAALRAYKQTHGDCNVPAQSKDNPELGRWAHAQRTRWRKNELSRDRAARLEQLGLVWDRRVTLWEEMFASLRAYKRAHGDYNVPRRWSENPQLASWCSRQRQMYNAKELSPDRIARVEQLGFAWNPFAAAWEEMFAALRAYKQTHDDCNVPAQWKDNPALGRWCGRQRLAYKRNKLSPDRITRLEQIGVQWLPHVSKNK